jgi:glycosyltransferase involved in cell wall biosynthesis
MSKVAQEPLVSIITPSYNTFQFIGETIESVLAQDYQAWEMIIVDDNSTDKSNELIRGYVKKDDRIKFIQNKENLGAAVSRNLGIEKAAGRFIAFLDSDDLWLPKKLTQQLDFMLRHNYSFTYTAYGKINEAGKDIGHIDIPTKSSYHSLLKTCPIGCLTAIYDTQVIGKVYLPLIEKRQDYGLWLRILKKIDFAYGVETTLAKYRVRSNSISSNKFLAAKYQWRIYRDLEKLSLLDSIFYMTTYTFNGVLKSYFN